MYKKIVLLLSLVALLMGGAVMVQAAETPPADPQTIAPTQQRLGEFRVEWYCNIRGFGVTLINNQSQWACTDPNDSSKITMVLGQADFDLICQTMYNNPGAYALRDQSKDIDAYEWSCYAGGAPTQSPNWLLAPQDSTSGRLGSFRVEWYCNIRGYGVQLINNNSDWACVEVGTRNLVFTLTQADFDAICKSMYADPSAYAVRDGNNAVGAYNWTCYRGGAIAVPNTNVTTNPGIAQATGNTLSPNFGVRVKVRSGPGEGYDELGQIDWRDTFPYLGQQGSWYVIDYNGVQGYVAVEWATVK